MVTVNISPLLFLEQEFWVKLSSFDHNTEIHIYEDLWGANNLASYDLYVLRSYKKKGAQLFYILTRNPSQYQENKNF